MLEIPLTNIPNQELSIDLNDQDCTIQVRQIGAYLYLTLWVNQSLIIENAICMPTQRILQGMIRGFTGNFVLFDFSTGWANQGLPNYEELGTRFKLTYLTESELSEYGL